MRLYRVTKKEYATLDGIGGLLVNGRWHDKGCRVAYLSENRALALLEFLVHLADYSLAPSDMMLMTVDVPDQFENLDPKKLPKGWERSPGISRKIGTSFLSGNKNLLLRVPSVLIPDEGNYLLNPLHELAGNCKIISTEMLNLDQRFHSNN